MYDKFCIFRLQRTYEFTNTCDLYSFNCALTLLVGHQEEHPAHKICVMGYWHGYLSGMWCK